VDILPTTFLKVDILPTMQRLVGGRLKYIGVPEPFLEVLTAKGISYQVE